MPATLPRPTAERSLERSLARRHQRLIVETAAQVDSVLAKVESGRWPEAELRVLIEYLVGEVLTQAVDEELEFFAAKPCVADVGQLHRDHARLRAAVDVLSRAADGEDGTSPARVAAAVRGVLDQLRRHAHREQRMLAECAAARPDRADEGVAAAAS